MTGPHDPLLTELRRLLLAHLDQLRSQSASQPLSVQTAWAAHIAAVEELLRAIDTEATAGAARWPGRSISLKQWQAFGRLLRDKRNAAGLSRVQLARRSKLSDATIKFLETARHPPSRATLIRLIGVAELHLSWSDVPGQPEPPAAAPSSTDECSLDERPWLHRQLNCFLTPSYDPLELLGEFSRFLNGSGGYVEQTLAYLDPYSATAYLEICRQSIEVSNVRARMPLEEIGHQIRTSSGPPGLQVLALGAGDGVLETRLVRHLLDAQVPSVELCLLDISQPLLICAYRHAADALADAPAARVLAVQCNFHHLPLYTRMYSSNMAGQRRLFCLLGGTLANLDHEPRFLRQSLLHCTTGDLLLLDIPTATAAGVSPDDIKRRDKLYAGRISSQYAAWLGGPLRRHCKEATSIEFHWQLDTHCPVPGSYALHAIATVKAPERADRQFSMFRITRYDPAKLAECLREIGWEEIGALGYAGTHSLRLYRKCGDGGQEQTR